MSKAVISLNKSIGISSYFKQTTFTGALSTQAIAETVANEFIEIETIYAAGGGFAGGATLTVYDKSIGAVVSSLSSPDHTVNSPGTFYNKFSENMKTYNDGGASGGVKIAARNIRLGPNCELRLTGTAVGSNVIVSVSGVRNYVSP